MHSLIILAMYLVATGVMALVALFLICAIVDMVNLRFEKWQKVVGIGGISVVLLGIFCAYVWFIIFLLHQIK